MNDEQKHEWLVCAESPLYFIHTYCQIYDATRRDWVPFKLWPGQMSTLDTINDNRLVVILKARQLGLSWLVLAYALWLMLFRPAATISLFSRREEEATYLLGPERLRGMYARLPAWMHSRETTTDNDKRWQLSNDSIARAFPTTAGDSYTVTLAIVDEADLAPDLGKLMTAAKPTIDGGGRLILLSRADKAHPQSEFKQIYRGAKARENGWAAVFLPWSVRLDRDQAWYADKQREIKSRTTVLDELHEQYPATDLEALAPKSLDKRIPSVWLGKCYREQAGLEHTAIPSIPGLTVYQMPRPDRKYVAGADPAEGNPTSDDSAATWLDTTTGEEVANLVGKFEPSVFAGYIKTVSAYFNQAMVLVERNNHGHAVILWLRDNYSYLQLLSGDDDRAGWLDNSKGKSILYDTATNAFKDGLTIVHTLRTWDQLASIEGRTLRAPSGQMDDCADSYALALLAVVIHSTFQNNSWQPDDFAAFGRRGVRV